MTEEQKHEIVAAILSDSGLEPGAVDHHWIDAYEVACGQMKTTIYMDMYHCASPIPKAAPAGFEIQN